MLSDDEEALTTKFLEGGLGRSQRRFSVCEDRRFLFPGVFLEQRERWSGLGSLFKNQGAWKLQKGTPGGNVQQFMQSDVYWNLPCLLTAILPNSNY